MSTKPGALRRGAVGRTRTPGFVQAGEPGAPKCAAGHRTRPEAPDMAPAASLLTMSHGRRWHQQSPSFGRPGG